MTEPTTAPEVSAPATASATRELVFAASSCVTRAVWGAESVESFEAGFWPPAVWLWSDGRAVSMRMHMGVISAVEGKASSERIRAHIDRLMHSLSAAERAAAESARSKPETLEDVKNEIARSAQQHSSYVGAFVRRGEDQIAGVAGPDASNLLNEFVGAFDAHIRSRRDYVPSAARLIEIIELGADDPPSGFEADRLDTLSGRESLEIGSARLEWVWKQVIAHRVEGPQMLFGDTSMQQGARRYRARLQVRELENAACRR